MKTLAQTIPKQAGKLFIRHSDAQKSSWLCLMLAAGMVLASCTTPPRGYVAREWSHTLRELNIVPVFPPREDVQVGDIYLAPLAPEAEAGVRATRGWTPLGLWVGSADVATLP